MFLLRAGIALGCALALAGPSSAQQTVDVASISGRVVDTTGSVVPGALVTATQLETNVAATAITDESGRFRFPYLRIGPYEVVASLSGFRDATRRLSLGIGAAYELPLTLEVAGLKSTISVNAEAPVLEAARSQIAATVSQTEVSALPMNGRNFLEVALLVPGVAPANIAGTQLFPETSAVPGITLSVGSQRNLSNNFIVDGLSANDDAAGLSGMTYGLDAIEQVQVVTSGAQAELGRALGGYINVVTKSGTNMLRGTIYDFVRDDALNARNALSGSKLPMRQSQFGASLGGPIKANRTFYFGNIELRRLDQTGLTTIAEASQAAVNARLDAVGYPGPRISTGTYPNPVDTTNVLAKLDHQVSGRDQLSIRYGRYDASAIKRARCRRPERSHRLVGPRQCRPGAGDQQYADPDAAHRARDPRAVRARRSRGAAERSRRAGGEHCRRGPVRHQLEQPDRPPEQDVPDRQQPLTPARRARAARRGGLSLQRRSDHFPSLGAWQLHVLVARQFPVRYLQQRGLHANLRHHRVGANQSQCGRLRAR